MPGSASLSASSAARRRCCVRSEGDQLPLGLRLAAHAPHVLERLEQVGLWRQ